MYSRRRLGPNIFAESNRATPIEPQTTRFYSQNCFPTTPPLPPKHQTPFAKLLSRYAPTTSQPPESIRKTALPPRPNDPQTTRFYSQNCSSTTPLLPPNHKNLQTTRIYSRCTDLLEEGEGKRRRRRRRQKEQYLYSIYP